MVAYPKVNLSIIFWLSVAMKSTTLRAGADDKPLRMVKTVLHELVKLRGTAIKGHLSMVPIDMEPHPIILAYIDLNLQVLIEVMFSFLSTCCLVIKLISYFSFSKLVRLWLRQEC